MLFCSYPVGAGPLLYLAATHAAADRGLAVGPLCAASQRQHGEQSTACDCMHQSGAQVRTQLIASHVHYLRHTVGVVHVYVKQSPQADPC